MADLRLIRLAWKKGASENPQEAGDWLPYTQQAQWLLQSLADARCAAFGAGTHWVEERVEAEVLTGRAARIRAERQKACVPLVAIGVPAQITARHGSHRTRFRFWIYDCK